MKLPLVGTLSAGNGSVLRGFIFLASCTALGVASGFVGPARGLFLRGRNHLIEKACREAQAGLAGDELGVVRLLTYAACQLDPIGYDGSYERLRVEATALRYFENFTKLTFMRLGGALQLQVVVPRAFFDPHLPELHWLRGGWRPVHGGTGGGGSRPARGGGSLTTLSG